VRLLLDEMWTAEIAVQLRRRGHDVTAATDPEPAARYRGVDDTVVFERAQQDRRAIVTDKVGDLRVGTDRVRTDRSPAAWGDLRIRPPFNRNLGAGIIGPMVRALDGLLREQPEGEPQNYVIYLRPSDDRAKRGCFRRCCAGPVVDRSLVDDGSCGGSAPRGQARIVSSELT
jgi:hypothetical protein